VELRETDPLPREVDLVRLRVQEWRQGKMGPCRMPSEIGAAAIGLAKGFGVCRIARAVGVDEVWLRTQVAQPKARPPFGSPSSSVLPTMGVRSRFATGWRLLMSLLRHGGYEK